MTLSHSEDQEYGAVFSGPRFNFFPVSYDTTIAETVLHDTLTKEN